MHFTYIAAPALHSFQPIYYGLVLLCVSILIIVIRQETKARKLSNSLQNRYLEIQLELSETIQNNYNSHKLMSMELDAINKSFSTFKNNNNADLKDLGLEQAAVECSLLLKTYQRIWEKL